MCRNAITQFHVWEEAVCGEQSQIQSLAADEVGRNASQQEVGAFQHGMCPQIAIAVVIVTPVEDMKASRLGVIPRRVCYALIKVLVEYEVNIMAVSEHSATYLPQQQV